MRRHDWCLGAKRLTELFDQWLGAKQPPPKSAKTTGKPLLLPDVDRCLKEMLMPERINSLFYASSPTFERLLRR